MPTLVFRGLGIVHLICINPYFVEAGAKSAANLVNSRESLFRLFDYIELCI